MTAAPSPDAELRAHVSIAQKAFARKRKRAGLLDFIPRISPRFTPPVHLAPLVSVIERAARGEPVHALIGVPPRHGKTETLLHGIAWMLSEVDPAITIGYGAYQTDLARSKSRNARDYAHMAGVVLREDANALGEWLTPQGGGLRATGIGGAWTGHGVRGLIVDDPFKDREEAESQLIRDKTYDWFQSSALTRVEPGGFVIVNHARWHDDDLIGRLQKESEKYAQTGGEEGTPWEIINLPAVDDNDDALWPARWNRQRLAALERKIGPYNWASLYQGNPQPRGGKLFKEPARYQLVELNDKRIIGAIDVAATKDKRANRSAFVAGACWFEQFGEDLELCIDILDVESMQEEIPEVCRRAQVFQHKWGCFLIIEASGVGKVVPQVLWDVNPHLRLMPVPAIGDKFTRGQAPAAAWNRGRIRVPVHAAWDIDDYLHVMGKFTGVNDARDDETDATVHLFNYAPAVMGQMDEDDDFIRVPRMAR